MDRIYFDIETFGDKPDIKDFEIDKAKIKVPASYKKPEVIEKYIMDEYASLSASVPERFNSQWRKNALDPYKCQVICIALQLNNENPFYLMDDNEFNLLRELEKFFQGFHQGKFMLFDWNGLEFDVPILNLHSAKYQLKSLYSKLPKDRYDPFHVDLMKRMISTVYNSYCSLNKACEFFDIPGKTEGMDGSKVHDLWVNGEREVIGNYAMDDIRPLPIIADRLCVYEPLNTRIKTW